MSEGSTTSMRVCVTGSEGLIGAPLVTALEAAGYQVSRLDVALPANDPGHGSIMDREFIRRRMRGCRGVLHLAAVSRVAWGEQDPERCWAVNLEGTREVLEAAAESCERPWTLFASSREVYGQPAQLPISEAAPRAPINVYGRSKAAAEELVEAAGDAGQSVAIVRFSNVYGGLNDHPDRVVPAFARAAARGEEIRVDGPDRTFDFTHVTDVVRGVMTLMALLETRSARALPPIHLASGRPATLGQVAEIARSAGGGVSRVRFAPINSVDVTHFVGDPARARCLLGWNSAISLAEGVQALVRAYRDDDRGTSLG